MRSGSKIVLIINAILSIIAAVFMGIGSAIFFVFSGASQTENVEKAIENGTLETDFTGTVAEQAEQVQLLFKILGVVVIFLAIIYIIVAIICHIANKKHSSVAYAILIGLGVISSSWLSLIGGILGIVANHQEANAKKRVE